MAAYLDILKGKSFRRIPGAEYNRVRESLEAALPAGTLFYEVALADQPGWASIRDTVYPPFARYLQARSLDPEKAEPVVVAVFHRGDCWLVRGRDFYAAFREMEGMNAAAFHFRLLQWLAG